MDHTSSTPLHLGNAAYSTINKRRANVYKFPILKSSEIIQCLKELEATGENSPITKEELEEPHHCKEKVRSIFLFLLAYVTGKDETNCQPTKAMLDYVATLEYPEIHPQESFMEMHFFVALRQLMERCLYSEFSFRDLHHPTAPRLRIQLSALINLVKYLEGEQLKVFNELNGPRADLILTLEETKAEQEAVHQAYLLAEEQAREKRIQLNEVMVNCEELEIEISRNNRLQKASREESLIIKKKATELNDKLQTAQWVLQELEAEEERLSSQIVSSPSRRKAELRGWIERVQAENEECDRLEVEIEESKTKYSNAVKIFNDFSSCIKDIDELLEVAAKYSQAVEKSNDVQRQIAEKSKEIDEVNQQIIETERDMFRLDEKFKSQRLQHQMKMVTLQESMDVAKRDLQRIEKDRRENMARIEAAEREVNTLQAMIEQEQRQGEREINAMISKYKDVERLFLDRKNKIMKAILSVTNETDASNKENNGPDAISHIDDAVK